MLKLSVGVHMAFSWRKYGTVNTLRRFSGGGSSTAGLARRAPGGKPARKKFVALSDSPIRLGVVLRTKGAAFASRPMYTEWGCHRSVPCIYRPGRMGRV